MSEPQQPPGWSWSEREDALVFEAFYNYRVSASATVVVAERLDGYVVES